MKRGFLFVAYRQFDIQKQIVIFFFLNYNFQEGQLKVKYVYKTADEVVQEGGSKRYRGDISSLSSVKVIDMTGPEQRILSGEIANFMKINSAQCHCLGDHGCTI